MLAKFYLQCQLKQLFILGMHEMKKRILLAGALFAACGAATAAEISYQLGVEAYHETYKETVDGAAFMKEEAPMLGLTGGVNFRFSPLDEVQVDGRYARGQSKYTGAYQGQPYGSLVNEDIDRLSWELSATYKRYVPEWDGVKLGLGLGHRYLEDRLDKYPGGYRRKNTLNYVTMGIERPTQFANGWTMTPAFRYKVLLDGEQKSDSQVNDLPSGMGYDLAVDFAKRNGKLEWVISPYLRTWHIKKSDSVYYLDSGLVYESYEPDNKTRELGVGLSVRF